MLLEAFQCHTVVKVLTWSSATINFTRASCSIEMENTGMVIPLHGQSCGQVSPTLGEGGGGSKESLCPSLIASWRVLNMYPTLKALRTAVTHQTCLVLWTWRKLANETNAKNAPKICWKIVLTWGIQTALAIHITQSQDYPYAKNEYKLVVAIYRTRMTILEQEMTADV